VAQELAEPELVVLELELAVELVELEQVELEQGQELVVEPVERELVELVVEPELVECNL
jgi:hypothetical protein